MENFEETKNQYSEDLSSKAEEIFSYGAIMFDVKLTEKAIKYMYKSMEIYPKENEDGYVNLMLSVVKNFIQNNINEKAKEICEQSLDYAIKLGNIKYIETAYFYKSKILQKENDFVNAEMYMNLSLDSLCKYGNKNDLYKRYIEVADMYYNMDNVAESIKYFSLAISLSEKL